MRAIFGFPVLILALGCVRVTTEHIDEASDGQALHEERVDGGTASVLAVGTLLVRKLRLLAWSTALCGAVGLAIGLLSPTKYESSATFLPQGSQAADAGLSLAASQLGLRVPNRDGFWGSGIFVELLRSRTILAPMATNRFLLDGEAGPGAMLMDILEVRASKPEVRLEATVEHLRKDVISAVDDRKLGTVRLTVRTGRPELSRALAEKLLAAVNEFNVQTRRSQASEERQFIELRLTQVEKDLREAENRMQAFLTANRTLASSPQLAFEQGRLQRELALRQQVHSSLVQSREDAKIKEVRDTPVITVVEQPQRPALPASKKAIRKGLLGALLGFAFAAISVLIANVLVTLKSHHAREVRDFVDAVTGVFSRLQSR